MSAKDTKCLIISDFNCDIFAAFLNNDQDAPKVQSVLSPFNQLYQALTQKENSFRKTKPDYSVVWTQPENAIESFNKVINYRNISMDILFEEVDEFSSLLIKNAEIVKALFVPTWTTPPFLRGWGMLDIKSRHGISNILNRMNLRLTDNLKSKSNIFLFDIQRWISAAKNAYNPKLWYMAKIPFGNEVFEQAVKDVKAAIRGIEGFAKKLIILDLDDTLWGGILGDIGWENLTLGGHDHIGEAFSDFQRALKSMKNRGILLGIVSKNEEPIALEAIEKHPEMILKLEDFAAWKINWNDKALNIVNIVNELNLGIQSVVFIDDNPIEQARVKEALPDVYVPEWPEDKMLYKSALLSLRCFDSPSTSNEDLRKTQLYVEERQRQNLKRKLHSFDDWLATLDMRIIYEELNKANLQRTAQLFNKTNQMNLSTRRITEQELLEWASKEEHKLWTFKVSDRVGDYGLTGIVSLLSKKKIGYIIDFILSCRVMGRKVEETMLHTVIQHARSLGLNEVHALHRPTSKNMPCFRFFKNSGFQHFKKEKLFIWKLSREYLIPEYIKLEYLKTV